jgi:hypothetical protein
MDEHDDVEVRLSRIIQPTKTSATTARVTTSRPEALAG